jgi:hypothetical protein
MAEHLPIKHGLNLGLPSYRATTPSNPASRTGICSRPGSNPISLNGEACMASTSSARRRRFLVRSSNIPLIRSRRRLQGLHEDILDVLKHTTFHPLVSEGFEFRSLNLNRHRRRPSLILLRPVSADRPAPRSKYELSSRLPLRAAGPAVTSTSIRNRWKRRPALCHPSASLGMTKGRAMLPCSSGGWRREQQVAPLRSPGFPVELGGFGKLLAPFFTERRTRCLVWCGVAENSGTLRSG